MEKRDNYEISARRARELFLRFDQQVMIEKFHLSWDQDFLYLDFIGETFRISRSSGETLVPVDGNRPAGFSEVMSIFDFLCHDDGPLPEKSGRLAPIGGVDYIPKTVGVEPFHLRKYAQIFDADSEKAVGACTELGGEKMELADWSYQIPVFSAAKEVLVSAVVTFYQSDEEFAPQLNILWDTEILRMLRYETMFYVEGCICERIRKLMERG